MNAAVINYIKERANELKENRTLNLEAIETIIKYEVQEVLDDWNENGGEL